jgi:mono/diheme cytochrome c family protein
MNPWLKRAAIAATLPLLLAAGAAGATWALSEHALARRYALPAASLAAASDGAAIERGRHLYATRGCGDCHGDDLGGRLAIDAGPVGRFYGTNLTLGGRGAAYDLVRFEHAVRHGVGADGRPLRLMPAEDFANLSDADVGALWAYVRSAPPVASTPPETEVSLFGRALHLLGQLPLLPAESIDHAAASAPKTAPAAEVGVDYGRYIAQGCVGCHGTGFGGGPVPGTPPEFKPASNLTPAADGLAGWSEVDFLRAMRQGVRPDGTAIDPFMPWRTYARMTDVELRAVYAYLSSLPPRPAGSR